MPPQIDPDTGVALPTSSDTDILTQLLINRASTDPELTSKLSQANNAYIADVANVTGQVQSAALAQQSAYTGQQQGTIQALATNADRIAASMQTQIDNVGKQLETSGVVTENVNNARNAAVLSLGGVQALDTMGLKIQQAMALNDQKQAKAQEAIKSSNPIIEGIASAFGITTPAQRAVDEASQADDYYTRTVSQRKDLVAAMAQSDTLVSQLGTSLNAATMKAALDDQAIKASTESAKLENLATTADSQSLLQMSNMQVGIINNDFNTVKTVAEMELKELTARNQALRQELTVATKGTSTAKAKISAVGSYLNKIDPELGLQYRVAAEAQDTAKQDAIIASANKYGEAAALLGTSVNSPDYKLVHKTVKDVAGMLEAGASHTEALGALKNPLFVASFMQSQEGMALRSGQSAVYSPASIAGVNEVVGALAAGTVNGGKGKPLTPEEKLKVRDGFLGLATKEAHNPFSAKNKMIRMDVATMLGVVQAAPDSQFAKSPVTQFLLNRYKENPKAVITLDDYKGYLVHNSMTGYMGNLYNSAYYADVIKHMNTMYSTAVNKSGIRVYGAGTGEVPEVLNMYIDNKTTIPVTSPDALAQVLRNRTGFWSPRVDIADQSPKQPLTDLLIPTTEGN